VKARLSKGKARKPFLLTGAPVTPDEVAKHKGITKKQRARIDGQVAKILSKERQSLTPKYPTSWNSKRAPALPVVAMTTRDEEGVTYEILVHEAGVTAYDGEGGIIVWRTDVPFGKSASSRAGGYSFHEAAREQTLIQTAWARVIRKSS
jgi:hypothetical protein